MDLQDEIEDSRTFAVGRKRDFQEATRDDAIEDDDSEAGDSKRLKLDHTLELEDISDSAEATANISESNARQETEMISPPQKTWNAGIQGGSGLRTSFGSKAKKAVSLPLAKDIITSEERRNSPEHARPSEEQDENMDVDGPAPSSDISSKFKKLSRKEEKLLQREDLDAYNTYRKSPVLNCRAKKAAGSSKNNTQQPRQPIVESKSTGEEEGEVSESGEDGADESAGESEGEDADSAATSSTSVLWILNGRFKKLKQPILNQLSKRDLEAYCEARGKHRAEQRQKTLVKNTATVDAFLRNDSSWPVANPQLAALVGAGKTLYPRHEGQGIESIKSLKSFILPRGLLALHLKPSDLTYEEFAHHFLIVNRDQQISKDKLLLYFRKFFEIWYGHVPYATWKDTALLNKTSDDFDLQAAQQRVASMPVLESGTTTMEESGIHNPLEPFDTEPSIEDSAKPVAPRDLAADLLQQKYFSGADGKFKPCISCAKYGHNWPNCSDLECSCGVIQDHSEMLCPQKGRCTKCQQVGHSRQECHEKLALPASEAPPCDLCNTRGHTEGDCHVLWRSFQPQPSEYRKVQTIPASCYCCGGDHFGSDCGLNDRSSLSGGFTWSFENLQRYVDPDSQDRALSAGVDYSIGNGRGKGNGKGFSIKGRANQYVALEESDDEEEAFIRPRVPPPQQPGHIRFNNNNQNNRPPNGASGFSSSNEPDYRNSRDVGVGSYSGGYAAQPSSSYNGYAPGLPSYDRGSGGGGKGNRGGGVGRNDVNKHNKDPKRRRQNRPSR